MEQIYTPKRDYKVLVCCFTYNQSKYITDALNGFAMQKTDFPFVCHIQDDASTDGERDVIMSWMREECDMESTETIDVPESVIIIAKHKENKFCTFAFYFLKKNLYKEWNKKVDLLIPWREHCKYEALCEGDDYWISEDKLQKQVDFLDANIDYGFVYSKVCRFDQNTNTFDGTWGSKCSYEDIISGWSLIPTLSACFRTNLCNDYNKSVRNDPKWPLADVPMWLYFLKYTKVKFMDEVTGVYRVLNESACHSDDIVRRTLFTVRGFECRAFYAERYWGEQGLKCAMPALISKYYNAYKEIGYVPTQDLISLMKKYHCLTIRRFITFYICKFKITKSLYMRWQMIKRYVNEHFS